MSRHSPRPRLNRLIVLAASLIGAALCALGLLWYLNRDNRWVALVTPADEKPTQILAVDRLLRVYVRTEQGGAYLCSGGTWRDTCQPVADNALPAARVPPRWLTCRTGFPETPAPPGVVADALEVGQCYEVRTYSKIVITTDGGLWQWRRTYSWAHQFALATSIVLGLGFGAAAGMVINALRSSLA